MPQAAFLPNYAHIAARKFMFFHGKNGAVRVKELLTSPLMQVRVVVPHAVLYLAW